MNNSGIHPNPGSGKTGKVIDGISSVSALTAGLMMLSVALFMSFEAFSRHFLDQPTSWVLSLSTLIFIWFTFLSVSYGIKSDKHVSCDVLSLSYLTGHGTLSEL